MQSVAFSPDGTTLVCGDQMGTVTFWHVPTTQELFRVPHVHNGMVGYIAFDSGANIMMTCALRSEDALEVIRWDGTPTGTSQPGSTR